MANNISPIGVFDSGVGGLSILRTLQVELPNEPILYIGDQAHVPYGSRPAEEIRDFSESITRYLINQGAKLVVVACNTASAAALLHLRETFPETPIVGMTPSVKQAAAHTQTGAVGVLATAATFEGKLYASKVEKYGDGLTILEDTCAGLVEQIEKGILNGGKTQEILTRALLPMVKHDIDAVILGCTHYPFAGDQIQQIVGDQVRLIDSSPAVVQRVKEILQNRNLLNEHEIQTETRILTTGNLEALKQFTSLVKAKGALEEISWNVLKS
ncbi:MAG: glutamate racemase [Chloroflexota bacterium]